MALLPLKDAIVQVLAGAPLMKEQSLELTNASGRVLAVDLKALRNQPPFAASAMDGYAVIAADLKKVPATLKLIGQAPAGRAFDGVVKNGETVRIFTGAPLPQGTDTVIMQENTQAKEKKIIINQSADAGNFVRPIGLDFKTGETVISANTVLNSRYMGLCAAMNYAKVPVRRKPVVALLATGDELVAPGGTLRPDQIVASNSIALAAAIEAFGGEPLDLGIVSDDVKQIEQAILRAKDADILMTIGGASVGDHDLVGPAFKNLGIELGFWKIAMRPGKPLMFAKYGEQRILGLPGNPVSSLICSYIFLKPLLEKMLGRKSVDLTGSAILTTPLKANDLRQDHLRATLSKDNDGRLLITPFSQQDSSMQQNFARADGLIIRQPFADAKDEGDVVPYLPLTF